MLVSRYEGGFFVLRRERGGWRRDTDRWLLVGSWSRDSSGYADLKITVGFQVANRLRLGENNVASPRESKE